MNDGEQRGAAQPLRCAAGHILAMAIGPVVVMKHDRRTFVGPLPFYIVCKCGGFWLNRDLNAQIRNALDGLRLAVDVADILEPPQDDTQMPLGEK